MVTDVSAQHIVPIFKGKQAKESKSSRAIPIKMGVIHCPCYQTTGTEVAQWLRHCATNRKVPRSIPDGVIGIFH
jgi:hypothetical protein